MFYEQDYERYLRSAGRLASTRQVHRYTLKSLTGFLASRGITEAKAVTTVHVDEFARTLFERGHAPRTVANELMRLRIYFDFLEKQKIIFLSPAAGLRTPRGHGGHHRAYPDGDLAEFLEKLDTSTAIGLRARAILELAYSAALRPREIRALKLSDIDRAKGMLFIEQSKNRKDRIVPVGCVALEWVDRYLREVRDLRPGDVGHDHVFVSHKTARPLSARGLSWAVEEACRKAAIQPIELYSMRTSAATNLLEAGMGVVHISRLLGHESIRTTQVYLHTRERELARLIEAKHPRFRQSGEGVSA